jgi:hypothetical protein
LCIEKREGEGSRDGRGMKEKEEDRREQRKSLIQIKNLSNRWNSWLNSNIEKQFLEFFSAY